MSGKLTKAQRETLENIARYGEDGTHYAEYYPPIKRLAALGYIGRRYGRFSNTFFVTPSGREALKAAQ